MTDPELELLKERYPSWQYGSVCTTLATGPESKRVTASKGKVFLTAWNVYELAAKIRQEESRQGT